MNILDRNSLSSREEGCYFPGKVSLWGSQVMHAKVSMQHIRQLSYLFIFYFFYIFIIIIIIIIIIFFFLRECNCPFLIEKQ